VRREYFGIIFNVKKCTLYSIKYGNYLQTALEMYTINGAYVMRQEDKTGSLDIGKEADLVSL
jgi:predicted amidohydrolase YtcJ